MSLEAMVQAARDGKINDFDTAFNSVMAQRTMQRIEDNKVEIGKSVRVDGEYTKED
ncbi:prohead [Vibrio phage D479]